MKHQAQQTTNRARWGSARAAFIACKRQIENLIEQGHSVKVIHERLGAKLPMSYNRFAFYVRQTITQKGAAPPGPAPSTPTPTMPRRAPIIVGATDPMPELEYKPGTPEERAELAK